MNQFNLYEGDDEVVVSPPGNLARVRHITNDGRQATLEMRSGQLSIASSNRPFELEEGDVVIVGDRSLELASRDLWTEESWVGVIEIKLDDVTVVDTGGRWRLVPTSDSTDYAVGNTVEVQDTHGVVRVLQKDPIRLVKFGEVDESILDGFKPTVREHQEIFDDFGGLPDVVSRARELIEIPLEHHEGLKAIKARPVKGVLFTGDPGTGKTMLARIIANHSNAVFLEISGPQFISKWVGQSEEILRLIFDYARKQLRCILFFDEIDSVASHRTDDSHESSRRVVAQLLTLMDGFTSADNVVVIAATNRPQDIDVALRRPGRFDWEIRFPRPGLKDREAILLASQRRHTVRGVLPHAYVASQTDGWTGAELAAIWTEAALLAVADERDAICAEDYLGGHERVSEQLAAQGQIRDIER